MTGRPSGSASRRTPRPISSSCPAESATTVRRRPGRHVAVQLADDRRRAPVPAQDQRALRPRRGRPARGWRRGPRPAATPAPRAVRPARDLHRVVVLRDDDHPVARPDRRVHRRVERGCAPSACRRPITAGVLVGEQRLAEGLADQRRLLLEVDLVAAEVQQLRIDHRQARLAAGLHDDARDQVARRAISCASSLPTMLRHLQVPRVAGSRPRCGRAPAAGSGCW